jgi:branched-chain amino acid transport system permease protein
VRSLAPALGVLAVQLIFFPLSPGLWVHGVIIGGLTALVALGMALTYRSNRIVNFAAGDLGTGPVVLVYMLMTAWSWPYLVSLGAGLVTAVVLGAVVELAIIRRFFRAPRLLLTVATIGLAQVLAFIGLVLPRLWGVTQITSARVNAPFDFHFTVGSGLRGVRFDANSAIALVAVPVVIGLLALLLRFTPIGMAVRASADDADRAALLGIPVKRLQTVVWSVAALLAFVAVFLRAGVLGLPLDTALSFAVLLRALTALVLGGMTDMVAITAASVALGILETGVGNHAAPPIVDAIFAVVVFVALLVVRPGNRRRAALDDTSSWLAADEVRPVPGAMARVPVVKIARSGAYVVLAAVALLLPHVLSVDRSLKASALLIYAVLGLSLVVLTGWAGQISLGQIGFFALGAALGGKATLDWHLDLSVALLLTAVAGAAVAVIVGLPAMRGRGLYLAVTTLAFSLAATSYLLRPGSFAWIPTTRIPRPPLFGRINIDSPTGIYYVVLGVLVLLLLGLHGVRRSRTGRAMLALRDNERGAQAYALSATRVRLVAFAISGAIAAMAGCLIVHHQQAYDLSLFGPGGNLAIFTMVVVGGIATPMGAVLGALYLQGAKWFLPADWQLLASGAGVLLILLVLPGGLGGLFFRGRDWWLQVVARRHAIDAPGFVPDAARPSSKPVPLPVGGGR